MDELAFLKLYFLFNIQCQGLEDLRKRVDNEQILLENDAYVKSLLAGDQEKYVPIWFKDLLTDDVINYIKKLELRYKILTPITTKTLLKPSYRPRTVLRTIEEIALE